jgi:hypothetical protein
MLLLGVLGDIALYFIPAKERTCVNLAGKPLCPVDVPSG